MSRPNAFLLAAYSALLKLIYPTHLYTCYRDQMLQTIRDADSDRTYNGFQFWSYLFADLIRSSLLEHTRMFRNRIFARPILIHTLALALILTVGGLFAALTIQAALRRSADQPQMQMADKYASALASGSRIQNTLPPLQVDIQHSLEPFAIFYDATGHAVEATGHLADSIPTPPLGVFVHMRTHAISKFTWQPRSGLRIAAVMRRVEGPQPGFILVGRSLQFTEVDEALLRRGTFVTWLLLMCLLAAGALYLDRAERLRRSPTPA